MSLEDAKSVIAKKLSEIVVLTDDINRKLRAVMEKIARKKELDTLLPQKSSALEKFKEELQNIKDTIKTKSVENESFEKRIAELC